MTTISSPRPSEHHRSERRAEHDSTEQFTEHFDRHLTEHLDGARRDRLRSAAPVVVATAVLLAALVGAALLAGNLVELGLFFMTSS